MGNNGVSRGGESVRWSQGGATGRIVLRVRACRASLLHLADRAVSEGAVLLSLALAHRSGSRAACGACGELGACEVEKWPATSALAQQDRSPPGIPAQRTPCNARHATMNRLWAIRACGVTDSLLFALAVMRHDVTIRSIVRIDRL